MELGFHIAKRHTERLPTVIRQSGAFFCFILSGRQLAFDPPCTDIVLLAACVPEFADIAMEFHWIRLHSFPYPAETGMNILQSEMFAAQTHLLFLLHDLPLSSSIEEHSKIGHLSLVIALTAIQIDDTVGKPQFPQIPRKYPG
jgi:hypothetical protein